MNRRTHVAVLVVLGLSVVLVGAASPIAAQSDSTMPVYFIAIHCEPYSLQTDPNNYVVLQEMVAYADDYDIKLTIMLTAQWADYIVADPARLNEVQGWMTNGHEIAGHHHSIFHGSWDGYTNFARNDIEAAGNNYGKYQGTLDDYMAALYRVNPDLQSACANDEQDKQALPDGIVYDTCSGFANAGAPGERLMDRGAEKGINEFVTVGMVNGIERKWLTHSQVYQNPRDAVTVVDSMDGGVYGVVTHAVHGQDRPLYTFMDFLHDRDPDGVLSRTVATVIEEQIIPEVVLPDDILTADYSYERPAQLETPCGDGVCDDLEQANPNLCPQDCE